MQMKMPKDVNARHPASVLEVRYIGHLRNCVKTSNENCLILSLILTGVISVLFNYVMKSNTT